MAGKHEDPQSETPVEKQRHNGYRKLTICLALLLIVAIGAIVFLIVQSVTGAAPNKPVQTSQTENGGLIVSERPEMLDITAYEAIELKADTLEQSIRFDNPLQNNCWLVITLSLEDGTVLWKSEELQPGQVVRRITMNRTLAKGAYENAVLSYQHWTYDEEKLPLNGAQTLVTLHVQ